MLLFLELALRVLPIVDGSYAADRSTSWPIRTMIANTRYTFSTGWNAENIHHGRINNLGYVAPFDYAPGSQGIVVIGDSYVASMMNDYDDTLQGALEHYLRTRRSVMGFGTSGADLPHYLGTARVVREHFSPQWAVFVITAGDYVGGFTAEPV